VAKNSPIRSAKDLNGKIIAVPGLGTNAEYAVHEWLDLNGADTASVKFIELAYAAMPAALEAGRIDAAHVAEPFIERDQQQPRRLWRRPHPAGRLVAVRGVVLAVRRVRRQDVARVKQLRRE
jgi:ABC-type amino acid transport substrate-binding protein